MPLRNKGTLSRDTRNALRCRLKIARETDEERSERLAAKREYQKQRYYIKKEAKTEKPPISQVRIVNVRTLRPGADKRCSEKDWLKAVKDRMYSEKAWLATMKEHLNSERVRLKSQRRLDCGKDVHCKPLLNSKMEPLNCANLFASEKDPSNSEQDSSSVEGGLNFLCLIEKTWGAQDPQSFEMTIKEEVSDTIKQEMLDD